MEMSYVLVVLTHGPSDTLQRTLHSFADKVRPRPERVLVHHDGPRVGDVPALGLTTEQRFDSEQRGFCQATRRLWNWASEQPEPFIFYLEHDFRFLRPVDLNDLAEPLREDLKLAQMQLMRNAVSVEEIAAGGLFEMRRADYERRALHLGTNDLRPWLQHRSYFTTNPSLMRTAFMAANPWPDDDEPHCEGRFSIGLVERGFHYGVWGNGEPWVQHHGRRTGFGY